MPETEQDVKDFQNYMNSRDYKKKVEWWALRAEFEKNLDISRCDAWMMFRRYKTRTDQKIKELQLQIEEMQKMQKTE